MRSLGRRVRAMGPRHMPHYGCIVGDKLQCVSHLSVTQSVCQADSTSRSDQCAAGDGQLNTASTAPHTTSAVRAEHRRRASCWHTPASLNALAAASAPALMLSVACCMRRRCCCVKPSAPIAGGTRCRLLWEAPRLAAFALLRLPLAALGTASSSSATEPSVAPAPSAASRGASPPSRPT